MAPATPSAPRSALRWPPRATGLAARRAGARRYRQPARPGSAAPLLGDRGREPGLRRRACHRARNPGPRQTRKAAAPHRRRHPHRPIPGPATRHVQPARLVRDRGRPGLHQSPGRPALAKTPPTTDFRSGHRPSRRSGRDRQTWPRHGDQATAGRTPHPTADACGHATDQARAPTEHHTPTVPQFRPTHTTTRGAGPPENTHRQRPRPFGPHRTHS